MAKRQEAWAPSMIAPRTTSAPLSGKMAAQPKASSASTKIRESIQVTLNAGSKPLPPVLDQDSAQLHPLTHQRGSRSKPSPLELIYLRGKLGCILCGLPGGIVGGILGVRVTLTRWSTQDDSILWLFGFVGMLGGFTFLGMLGAVIALVIGCAAREPTVPRVSRMYADGGERKAAAGLMESASSSTLDVLPSDSVAGSRTAAGSADMEGSSAVGQDPQHELCTGCHPAPPFTNSDGHTCCGQLLPGMWAAPLFNATSSLAFDDEVLLRQLENEGLTAAPEVQSLPQSSGPEDDDDEVVMDKVLAEVDGQATNDSGSGSSAKTSSRTCSRQRIMNLGASSCDRPYPQNSW